MKNLIATFAFLSLIGAAPSAAAQTPVKAEMTVEAPSFRARVTAALDELAMKLKATKGTRADYQKAADAIIAAAKAYEAETPHAISTRDRLIARLNELESKAQTAMFDLLELDAIKDAAIDAELDFALARLKARALTNKAAAEDYDAVVKALTARADAAKAWNPEIEAISGRLQAAITALIERAKASGKLVETDFQIPLDIASESRISMTYHRLEKRGMDKKTIESDYGDVKDAVMRIPAPADYTELQKKVQTKLDELKAAVRSDKITREQFQTLKDMLMARARAASSPK